MITRNRCEMRVRKETQGWEELKWGYKTSWLQGIWKCCQPVELVNLIRTKSGGRHYRRSRNICGKHNLMENIANGTSFYDVVHMGKDHWRLCEQRAVMTVQLLHLWLFAAQGLTINISSSVQFLATTTFMLIENIWTYQVPGSALV